MKIAILSDIHGNTVALDAVLADIAQNRHVDHFWVLGDLTALGFDPVGVIERVQALPNAVITYGNADYYPTSGNYPAPFIADVEANPALLTQYGEVQRSFAWTAGMVTQAGHFDWLATLPLDVRLTLPDGTRVLGVHASPNAFEGAGFYPDRDAHPVYSEKAMTARLAGANADLLLAGHCHWPMNEIIAGVHVVVTGGISNQSHVDRRAKYVILDTDAELGYSVTHHYVAYDYQAHIAALIASHHPSMDFIMQFARGEFVWSKQSQRTKAELRAMLPIENKPYYRSELE